MQHSKLYNTKFNLWWSLAIKINFLQSNFAVWKYLMCGNHTNGLNLQIKLNLSEKSCKEKVIKTENEVKVFKLVI